MPLLTELKNYFGLDSTKISPLTGLEWSATFRSLHRAKANGAVNNSHISASMKSLKQS
jgi:hypothetical protein